MNKLSSINKPNVNNNVDNAESIEQESKLNFKNSPHSLNPLNNKSNIEAINSLSLFKDSAVGTKKSLTKVNTIHNGKFKSIIQNLEKKNHCRNPTTIPL